MRDWMELVRTVTAEEVIITEIAKAIADELSRWPPQLEWTDDLARERFAMLYDFDGPRPDPAALTEGFRLARWDLARQTDEMNYYLRNDHMGRAVTDETQRLIAQLVWRYLTELLLDVAERLEGRLRRPQLLLCLDEAEKRLATR
jgi:hypothetical protein